MSRQSLKFRLSLYFALTILMVGAVAGGFIILSYWRHEKAEFSSIGFTVAGQLAVTSMDEILRKDSFSLYETLESRIKTEEGSGVWQVEYMEVLDEGGSPLASVSDKADTDARGYLGRLRGEAAGADMAFTRLSRLKDGTELRDTAYPVFLDGARIGTIRVGISDRYMHRVMKEVIRDTLGVVLVACLLGIVMGGRIAGWVARPIRVLAEGAEGFSAGNLDLRVDVASPREIGVLATSFNGMAEALKEKMQGLDRARKEAEALSRRLAESLDASKLSSEKLQETNEWVTDLAFKLEEANQYLKAEKHRTEAVVLSIRDALVAMDGEDRIILLNPEAEEIFEIRSVDAKGEPVQVLVDRLVGKVEDPEEFLKKFVAAVSTPETDNVFTITLLKPYRRVLRRFSSAIRDEKGEVIGRIVTFRDVTRERELDDMKTNFVSTVSHELRTPLTSVKGAVNLLLEGEIDDPDTRREFLKIIEQNTNRLVGLITDLLDLSRLEEGAAGIKPVKMDMTALVKAVVNSSGVLARQNGVTLDGPDTVEAAEILGDREKLGQLLVNLIGNAVKFSEPGGRVRVTVGSHEDDIRVCVEDEGIGIPRDKLEKVFDSFYQVDMSATRKKGGTGLGLAICRAVAKEHGGRIWAESPATGDGKGSRFVLSLPRPAFAAMEETRRAARAENGHSAAKSEDTVLLVDSDPSMLRAHKLAFEKEGFRTLVAATGRDALELARENLPAFIFLDVLLPDLDGFDVASILKGDDATRDIPIIFTTFMDAEGVQKCMRLGNGYIAKPCREDELIAAVKRIL